MTQKDSAGAIEAMARDLADAGLRYRDARRIFDVVYAGSVVSACGGNHSEAAAVLDVERGTVDRMFGPHYLGKARAR